MMLSAVEFPHESSTPSAQDSLPGIAAVCRRPFPDAYKRPSGDRAEHVLRGGASGHFACPLVLSTPRLCAWSKGLIVLRSQIITKEIYLMYFQSTSRWNTIRRLVVLCYRGWTSVATAWLVRYWRSDMGSRERVHVHGGSKRRCGFRSVGLRIVRPQSSSESRWCNSRR